MDHQTVFNANYDQKMIVLVTRFFKTYSTHLVLRKSIISEKKKIINETTHRQGIVQYLFENTYRVLQKPGRKRNLNIIYKNQDNYMSCS